MLIRGERPGDEDAIHELTWRAFLPMPFSDNTEADIVRKLRAAGDLALSLVAEEEGAIIGHVAFSPVTIAGGPGGWFGLGPISVKPERQRQGIGRALTKHGLDILKGQGAAGCALIGNSAVYGSMGFKSDGRLRYRNLDTKFVQWLMLKGAPPSGELQFAPAFGE